MPEQKLRVMARGTAMVPHYEAAAAFQGSAPTRFHSHSHHSDMGPSFVDATDGGVKRHGAFLKRVGVVIELPVRGEYLRHLRDGDLYPADVETAQMAGIALTDAMKEAMTSEHGDEAKAAHDARVAEVRAQYADAKPAQPSKAVV